MTSQFSRINRLAKASLISGLTTATAAGLLAAPAPASASTTAKTTTVLSASSNPVSQGANVTLEAHVIPTPSGGTVNFYVNGKPINQCQDVSIDASNGSAMCTTEFGEAGRLGLQAFYKGVNGFRSSSSNVYEMARADG